MKKLGKFLGMLLATPILIVATTHAWVLSDLTGKVLLGRKLYTGNTVWIDIVGRLTENVHVENGRIICPFEWYPNDPVNPPSPFHVDPYPDGTPIRFQVFGQRPAPDYYLTEPVEITCTMKISKKGQRTINCPKIELPAFTR